MLLSLAGRDVHKPLRRHAASFAEVVALAQGAGYGRIERFDRCQISFFDRP